MQLTVQTPMCPRYENLLLNRTAPPPNLPTTFAEGTWESSRKHGWNLPAQQTHTTFTPSFGSSIGAPTHRRVRQKCMHQTTAHLWEGELLAGHPGVNVHPHSMSDHV